MYASQPVQKPVTAATQRQGRDQQAEAGAEDVQMRGVGAGGRGEHDEADDVRSARRARVLERALTEARLDHLEVEEARQARTAART